MHGAPLWWGSSWLSAESVGSVDILQVRMQELLFWSYLVRRLDWSCVVVELRLLREGCTMAMSIEWWLGALP